MLYVITSPDHNHRQIIIKSFIIYYFYDNMYRFSNNCFFFFCINA